MALSVVSSGGVAVTEDRPQVETIDFRNDAFSFWKLPENHRAELEQS